MIIDFLSSQAVEIAMVTVKGTAVEIFSGTEMAMEIKAMVGLRRTKTFSLTYTSGNIRMIA